MREIIGIMPVTPIPQFPGYVKGVINLRHKVIPVIDLRLKFGMEPMDCTERTCIIVVEIETGDQKASIGAIVDSVSEVLNIKANEIEDMPGFGAGLDHSCILGLAKSAQGVKILLSIDGVLSSDELVSIRRAA